MAGQEEAAPVLTHTHHTHIKGQHLHGSVEEFIFWVFNVSATEEEPAGAKQASEP